MSPDAPTAAAWLPLAARALRQAAAGELAVAGRTVARIQQGHGPDVIPDVMLAWIDTTIAAMGGPGDPSRPVQLGFVEAETGRLSGADDVPARTAWAGRVVAARVADDEDQFNALLRSVATGSEWGPSVGSLLSMCALNLKARGWGQ